MVQKVVHYSLLGLFFISVLALLQATNFNGNDITGKVVDTQDQTSSGSDVSNNEVKILEEKYNALKAQVVQIKQKMKEAQKRKDRKAYAETKKELANAEKELAAAKKAYEKAKNEQVVVATDEFTNKCTDGGDNACIFVFNKDGKTETWQIPFIHSGVFSLANGFLKVNVIKPFQNSCEIALCQKEDCSDAYTGGAPGIGELKKQKMIIGSSLSVADGSLSLKITKQCVYDMHTCPYGEVFTWKDQGFSSHTCSLEEPKKDFTNQCTEGGDNGCILVFSKEGMKETWQLPILHSGVLSLADSYTKLSVLKSGTNYCTFVVCQKEDCSDAYTGGAPGVGELKQRDLMTIKEKNTMQLAGGVLSLESTNMCVYDSHVCPDGTVFKLSDQGYSSHVCHAFDPAILNDPTVIKGSKGYCKDADGPIDETKYPIPWITYNYNQKKQWNAYVNPYVNNPVYVYDFETQTWKPQPENCINEEVVHERFCIKSNGDWAETDVSCPEGMMCTNGACIFKNQQTAPAVTEQESCTKTYECKLVNPEGSTFVKLGAANPHDKMTWMQGHNSMEFEFVSATQKSCVIKYKYCEHPYGQESTCDPWSEATVTAGKTLPKSVKLSFITEGAKVCQELKAEKEDKQPTECSSETIQCTYSVGDEVVTLKTGEKTKSYVYDPANGYSFTMKQEGIAYNKQGCAVVFNHCSPAGCFDIPQGTTFPFEYVGKYQHFGEGTTSLYVKLQKYTCEGSADVVPKPAATCASSTKQCSFELNDLQTKGEQQSFSVGKGSTLESKNFKLSFTVKQIATVGKSCVVDFTICNKNNGKCVDSKGVTVNQEGSFPLSSFYGVSAVLKDIPTVCEN